MRKLISLLPLILIANVAIGASYFVNRGIVVNTSVITADDSLQTLVATSNQVMLFEGATRDSVRLPDAQNLPIDWWYEVINNASGEVTVYDGTGAFLATTNAGRIGRYILKDVGSQAGSWKFSESASPSDIPPNFDDLYYRKTEHVSTSTGAPDAGKPIVLNGGGLVDNTMLPSSAVSAWGTAGNTGTDPSMDFVGTIDAVDFVLRTGNVEWLRITAAGAIDTTLSTGAAYFDATGILSSDTSVSPTELGYIGNLASDAQAQITAVQNLGEQALSDAADAQQDIDDHIADTAGAHTASAIANVPSGNLVATEVQAALNELQTESDSHVVGPASSTDNAITRWDGLTGKLVKNSTATLDNSGNVAATSYQATSNGTAATPAFYIPTGSGNFGFYFSALNGGTLSYNGTDVMRFSATQVASLARMSITAGGVSNVGLYFSSENTSGLYRIGANNIGLAISGTKLLDMSAALFGVTGDISVSSAFRMGQIATPANPSAGTNKLYFKSDDKLYKLNSAGAEVEVGGGGSVSPLTTKGDIYTYSTTNDRLPTATNNSILVPNSSATTGLEWVTTLPTAAIPAFTGDVTNSAGSLATTIANDAVTNAKSANMAQSTIKGRAVSAGTGDPTDLTAAQATAILDNVVGDSGSGGTKGLVPAPASGDAAADKFLHADGTWQIPAGGGGGGVTAWAAPSPSFTFNNVGTLTLDSQKVRCVGDTLEFNFAIQVGTITAADFSINIPTAYAVDTSKLAATNTSTIYPFSGFKRIQATTGAEASHVLFYDGSDATKIFMSMDNSGGNFLNKTDASVIGSNGYFHTWGTIPGSAACP